ncbi:MAG TPA: hypothetical protein VF056_03675, partial [Thermoleophilaceae bacterium]
MAHLLRQRRVSLLGLLAGCAVLPAAVVHFFGETEVQIPGAVHFLSIGISAGLAAAAALALTVAGARRGDGRAVLIGTAFSSMAALLSIHGLTTPGFLVGDNGLVAFSGALTLPVGGGVLALSAIPELRRPTAVRPVLVLQGALLAGIVGLGVVGILEPSFVPAVPEAASTAAWLVLGFGLVFYGALAVRAARTYLLTRRMADMASTGAAIRAGSVPRTSTSRRASWPSATCSTPCCPSGSTARPGRSTTLWSCSASSPGPPSTRPVLTPRASDRARAAGRRARGRRLTRPLRGAQLARDRLGRPAALLAHVAETARPG